MRITVIQQVFLLLGSAILMGLSILLMSKIRTLFRFIGNEWLRKNLVVMLIAACFVLSTLAITAESIIMVTKKNLILLFAVELFKFLIATLFVFNIVWAVECLPVMRKLSFVKSHTIVILTIILTGILITFGIHYVENKGNFETLRPKLTFAFYNACAAGLIYTAVRYMDLERKQKLDEKELELIRLNELKTKAELEALHSKINPHFLYNALNSIADLSITDGKKARHMSISLADLFRYSINYSNSNFSTVKDELAMASTYLDIEKIRFEDRLNYSIQLDEAAGYYLVPRFVLQPLVENAVKHALKVTGNETQIDVEARLVNEQLVLRVCDSGPAFPETLNPGYGLKSVFDKLELLFPGRFEVKMLNEPAKCFEITITKPTKDEPAL